MPRPGGRCLRRLDTPWRLRARQAAIRCYVIERSADPAMEIGNRLLGGLAGMLRTPTHGGFDATSGARVVVEEPLFGR